jgi:hypothetical protein
MLYAVEVIAKSLLFDEKDELISKLEDLGMKVASNSCKHTSSLSKHRNKIDFTVKGKWSVEKVSQIMVKHWAIDKSFPEAKVVTRWRGRGICIENDPDICIKYD